MKNELFAHFLNLHANVEELKTQILNLFIKTIVHLDTQQDFKGSSRK